MISNVHRVRKLIPIPFLELIKTGKPSVNPTRIVYPPLTRGGKREIKVDRPAMTDRPTDRLPLRHTCSTESRARYAADESRGGAVVWQRREGIRLEDSANRFPRPSLIPNGTIHGSLSRTKNRSDTGALTCARGRRSQARNKVPFSNLDDPLHLLRSVLDRWNPVLEGGGRRKEEGRSGLYDGNVFFRLKLVLSFPVLPSTRERENYCTCRSIFQVHAIKFSLVVGFEIFGLGESD